MFNPVSFNIANIFLSHQSSGGNEAPQRIAFIINGDESSSLAEVHLQNVEQAVKRLKAEGFDKIYVLSPKPPVEKVVYYNKPTFKNLQKVITQLKQNLRTKDSLFIYTTGHGDFKKRINQACLVLPKKCVTEKELSSLLKELPENNQTIIMDQCYGGSWVDSIAAPNRLFLANTRKKDTGSCKYFSQTFWGEKVPDLNHDQIYSIQERGAAAIKVQAKRSGGAVTISIGGKYVDRGLGSKAIQPSYPAKVLEIHGTKDFDNRFSRYPHGVTVINFSAKWCGPCQKFNPKYARLAEQFNGSVQFLYVDTDENKQLAERYKVREYPTIIIVKEGTIVRIEDYEKLDQDIKLVLLGTHPRLKLTIKGIVAEIQSPDPEIRSRAMSNLLYYYKYINRNKKLIEIFVDSLENCPASDVRPFMIGAIGELKIKDKRVNDLLIKALEHSEYRVRWVATWTIGELGIKNKRLIDRLIKALDDSEWDVRHAAVVAVEKLNIKDNRSIGFLIKALEDENGNVRKSAVSTIGELGIREERFVDPLIMTLGDSWRMVRRETAVAIGKLGIKDKGFIGPLIKALRDEYPDVRRAVAGAIGKLRINDKRFINPLIRALGDYDPDVHKEVVVAFRKLGIRYKRLTKLLINASGNSDPGVRQAVVKAVRKLKDRRLINLLIKAMIDSDPLVRKSSILSIGELGFKDRRFVVHLITALVSSNPGIRQLASESISKLKDKRFVLPLIGALYVGDSSVQIGVILTIGELGIKDKKFVNPLIKALEDSSPDVRMAAAKTIGKLKIKDEGFIDPLIEALGDSHPNVRSVTAKAIGDLGIKDERFIGPLIKALGDSSFFGVRWTAAFAIGELGIKDERFVKPLIKALNDNDSFVRSYAAEAMEKLGIKIPSQPKK